VGIPAVRVVVVWALQHCYFGSASRDDSIYGKNFDVSHTGNGLLFHMTQPTSRSTTKAIAWSKPTISEN